MATPYEDYLSGKTDFIGLAEDEGQEGKGFKLTDLFGPISMGLNIASGLFRAEGLRKRASGYHDDYKGLMLRSSQVIEQGFQAGMDIEREGHETLGTMTAMFGKSGTLFEGSPLLAELDLVRSVERNRLRVMEEALIESAALYREAKKAKQAARAAQKAATTEIVGAVGGAALQYAMMRLSRQKPK